MPHAFGAEAFMINRNIRKKTFDSSRTLAFYLTPATWIPMKDPLTAHQKSHILLPSDSGIPITTIEFTMREDRPLAKQQSLLTKRAYTDKKRSGLIIPANKKQSGLSKDRHQDNIRKTPEPSVLVDSSEESSSSSSEEDRKARKVVCCDLVNSKASSLPKSQSPQNDQVHLRKSQREHSQRRLYNPGRCPASKWRDNSKIPSNYYNKNHMDTVLVTNSSEVDWYENMNVVDLNIISPESILKTLDKEDFLISDFVLHSKDSFRTSLKKQNLLNDCKINSKFL
jgi:hypothetical protein